MARQRSTGCPLYQIRPADGSTGGKDRVDGRIARPPYWTPDRRARLRMTHRASCRVASAAVLCLLLAAPDDATARKFQMSGTWVYRRGGSFVPLQFAAYAMSSLGTFVLYL